jgi:hypothetical protein
MPPRRAGLDAILARETAELDARTGAADDSATDASPASSDTVARSTRPAISARDSEYTTSSGRRRTRRRTRLPEPMDSRSWYMTRAAADSLSGHVDDLFFETRAPKWMILSVLVAVVMRHTDEVRGELAARLAARQQT